MKIGLIDVDGHGFPNLALMKLAAYHKAKGDIVEWASFGTYDRTYMSKVFTFTPDATPIFADLGEVIRGGTGYNLEQLPIEIDNMHPDLSIYPMYTEAYGFLTRGCPNKCPWCIVPKKEGPVKPYADIETILQGRKTAILMDNNVLSSDYGLEQIEKIIELGIRVDFNQGLDARIIAGDDGIAKLLAKVKWYKPIRMACDTKSQMSAIKEATELLRKYGAKPTRYFVFVLLRELQESYERLTYVKDLGLDAFAQPYRTFTGHDQIPQWQADMARYTNMKAIYKTIDFMNYQPRRGFKCSEYFTQQTTSSSQAQRG